VIGLLGVVRMPDLGFHEALHRPFNPVNDWRLLGPAVDMLHDCSYRAGRMRPSSAPFCSSPSRQR
jgi:hypothetical protein